MSFPTLVQLNRDLHAEEQVLDKPNHPQDTFHVVIFYFHLISDWSAMCQTENYCLDIEHCKQLFGNKTLPT